MLDDVVGLVMVQVISNLGGSDTSVDAVTVIRPILVSLAFAALTPVVCVFLVKPATLWLNAKRMRRPAGYLQRLLGKMQTAFVIHTLILLGLVTGSTYTGTSNLFAAYIAGASISWWDSEVAHFRQDGHVVSSATQPERAREGTAQEAKSEESVQDHTMATKCASTDGDRGGIAVYERFYLEPVNRILKPFFFVSMNSSYQA